MPVNWKLFQVTKSISRMHTVLLIIWLLRSMYETIIGQNIVRFWFIWSKACNKIYLSYNVSNLFWFLSKLILRTDLQNVVPFEGSLSYKLQWLIHSQGINWATSPNMILLTNLWLIKSNKDARCETNKFIVFLLNSQHQSTDFFKRASCVIGWTCVVP